MIYVFYGSDKEKARAKARQLIDSLVAKKPDASVGRYNPDNFKPEMLDELIGGQGLFVKKMIVELDRLLDSDFGEPIFENLKRLAESENIFVILEEKILKPELKKLEKHATKIQACDKDKEGELGRVFKNSPFAMAEAFGQRDKRELWSLFVEQKTGGAVAEEIHGMLFWQLKSILLASQAPSAEEAGLKPFVYSKSKQLARNFSAAELRSLSSRMISIYHDAHRGLGDLDLLLEKLILEL
jgi:hypothetical protein